MKKIPDSMLFSLFLEYESVTSFWTWLPFDFVARWIVRRTVRKYHRYLEFKNLTEGLNA